MPILGNNFIMCFHIFCQNVFVNISICGYLFGLKRDITCTAKKNTYKPAAMCRLSSIIFP